jgi:hypothetical protein
MAALENSVKVTISGGGIGRVAPGKDYYAGMIFQNATAPTNFADGAIVRLYSLAQAISEGIVQATYPGIYYHISEYFRVCEKLGVGTFLDVSINNIPTGAFDGDEITVMQNNANGELRYIGVYLKDDYASSYITGSQAAVEALAAEGKPCSVVIGCNFDTGYFAGTPADLRLLDSEHVQVCIAQGAGTDELALYSDLGYSVTAVGAMLATMACSKVHEHLGYKLLYNIQGPSQLQTLAFADGSLVKSYTNTAIDAIKNKGFCFLLPSNLGSFWYDTPTCTAATSDFAFLEPVRVMDKAKRLIEEALEPTQNAPLYVDKTSGKLSYPTIQYFTGIVNNALLPMSIEGNISGFNVSINPDQAVLQTSRLDIVVSLTPVGVGRDIRVTLQYKIQ